MALEGILLWGLDNVCCHRIEISICVIVYIYIIINVEWIMDNIGLLLFFYVGLLFVYIIDNKV